MIYPSPDKLDAMESKYALVIVAAKRARQLREGARRLLETRSGNHLTIALEEIAAAEIIPVQVGEPEKLPTSVSPSAVLTGLVATAFDEDEPLHEPTAEELGALLSPGTDLAAFEPDAQLDDNVLQTQDDVMEAEIDAAAEEGPYGLAVAGAEHGDDTAQDIEDEAIDDSDHEEE